MRNQNIAKVLKEYRKRNHLSVNDVSILLEDRSFTAAPKTIYGWESGQANPSADILLTLCDLYNITDILEAFGYDSNENFHVTPSERTIIEAYCSRSKFLTKLLKTFDKTFREIFPVFISTKRREKPSAFLTIIL